MAQADGTIYINTAIEADGMKAGGKEVEAAARRMAKSVSGIGASAKLALQKQADSFIKQNQLYAQQEQKVESLRAKLEEMKGQKIATDEFKAIGKQIDSDLAKLNRLEQTQKDFIATGGKENSSGYKRRQMQIEELRASLENAKKEQEQLLQSGEAYKPVDTSRIEEQLVTEQERLHESANRLGTSYQNLKQKTDNYAASAKILDGTKKRLNATLKNTEKLLIKNASAMLGLHKNTKKSNVSLGKSLKIILKYTLGIRSAYILFNKIRNAIKEGFSNLAQYSSDTNKSISSLMSALTQLKNSLATAFNPILTVVSPALTKLINMLSQAATYVGMFFAALTGQKSFVKAIAVQEDYAASLGDTANAAKKADKYLSGLDEIRRFESGDDSGKGGGGGGVSPSEMFETVPIESSIADMVQKIKDLIKNEDWEGLGAYMAAGLNAGLQKVYDLISWDNVGPKLTYFINAFTTWFNSLLRLFDAELLGRVIGAGINTIVNSMNLLIGEGGIDFELIGEKISNGLRGMIDEVEWSNLGELFANRFMIAWRMLDGFVTDMFRKSDDSGLTGWQELGNALADGINGAIENINLETVFSSLSGLVIGILEALSIAIQKTDWEGVGQQIAEALRAIDWVGIASGLFDVGLALISGLLEAFGELPIPVQLAAAAIGGFFAAFAAASIITNIISAIQGIITVVMGVVGVLGGPLTIAIAAAIAILTLLVANWDKVKAVMENFDQWLQTVFSTDWERMFGVFGGIVGAFATGLEGIWNGIKQIFNGFITFISGVFSSNWRMALEGLISIFKGVFGTLVSIAKIPINGIIGLINGMIFAIESGINKAISMINKLSFDVPDWVPAIGGKHWGFNFPKIHTQRIPYLASGAVIPPNAPFLAMLGDQRNGNNLEMPENLLRKIIREEGGKNQQAGGTSVIKLYLDGKQIAEAVVKQGKVEQMSSGRNIFALG